VFFQAQYHVPVSLVASFLSCPFSCLYNLAAEGSAHN